MDSERLAKVTEAQRACLRLVLAHCESKEIAIRLGISPIAVVERLRLARHTLGVSRSIDAARLLAAHESAINNRFVDIPHGVETATILPAFRASNEAGIEADTVTVLREEQASYQAFLPTEGRDVSLRIPLIGGLRDDLNAWQIIVCCIVAGALAIAAFGILLKVSHEISISEQRS